VIYYKLCMSKPYVAYVGSKLTLLSFTIHITTIFYETGMPINITVKFSSPLALNHSAHPERSYSIGHKSLGPHRFLKMANGPTVHRFKCWLLGWSDLVPSYITNRSVNSFCYELIDQFCRVAVGTDQPVLLMELISSAMQNIINTILFSNNNNNNNKKERLYVRNANGTAQAFHNYG